MFSDVKGQGRYST